MHHDLEEILEVLFLYEEEDKRVGEPAVSDRVGWPAEDQIRELIEDGLLEEEDEQIRFTPRGRDLALGVIRRHRLAERLFTDVLEMHEADIEEPACRFEHVLSEDVEDNICTLLGHPRECPHGRPIPEGRCCRESHQSTESIIVPLSTLEPGASGRVAYLSTKKHRRLHRITSLGVLPGCEVRVHQRRPAYVIQVDETMLAMEADLAEEIYVRRVNGQEKRRRRARKRGQG